MIAGVGGVVGEEQGGQERRAEERVLRGRAVSVGKSAAFFFGSRAFIVSEGRGGKGGMAYGSMSTGFWANIFLRKMGGIVTGGLHFAYDWSVHMSEQQSLREDQGSTVYPPGGDRVGQWDNFMPERGSSRECGV